MSISETLIFKFSTPNFYVLILRPVITVGDAITMAGLDDSSSRGEVGAYFP